MTTQIRSLLAWTAIVALAATFGALTVLAQSDADQELFTADGIDAPIVARADVSAIDPGSTLLFERIELPPATELPARTTTSPELYYVQSGEFSIQDDFGFGTIVPAGAGLTIKAGTTLTASNAGSEPASVLRLRVAKAADASSEQGVAEATPAGEAGIATSVMIEMPLEDAPADVSQMYLARATFAPGSATGEQAHTGSVGVYVESGTLSIASPSGFEGTVGADQGVVLPPDTPLQASAIDAEAVVVLVGIGTAAGPFSEVTPEPEPSATRAPASNAGPMVVPGQASPQASPIAPGATPVGTPIVVTQTGVLLQMGETWQVDGASLHVQVGEFSSRRGVRITFTYRNLSDSRVDFTIPNGYVDVHDDLRNPWKPVAGGSYTGVRVILDPDDSFEGGWWWKPENVDLDKHSANVFVTFRNFGAVPVAKWGFTVATGWILTIPPDAVDPVAWQLDPSDVAALPAGVPIG